MDRKDERMDKEATERGEKGMTKPQPLDLKAVLEQTFEYIWGEDWKDYVRGDIRERFTDAELYTHLLDLANNIIDEIKSACEFYLRYKDKPHLLIQEYPKYEKQARKFLDDVEKYNDWLFKLAFGGVLG